jgi:hypothetical protein
MDMQYCRIVIESWISFSRSSVNQLDLQRITQIVGGICKKADTISSLLQIVSSPTQGVIGSLQQICCSWLRQALGHGHGET